MNRHSVRLLVAVLAAAGLAGCFSDPASSLRNGPASLSLSRSAAAITNGDSLLVEAVVRDEAGNPLPTTGATWTTDNASVASVNLAATQAPEEGTSRAYVAATNAAGAITYVRVNVRGLTDSIRIISLPATLPTGLVSYTGTAKPDTILTNAFTAPDTVIFRSGPTLSFDGAASVVRFGTANAYILFRSDTMIKVMARGPWDGAATITRITYPGNAVTGPILLDSLFSGDNVLVSRARLQGTTTVAGDTLIVTATGLTSFSTTTSQVWLGPTQALVLSNNGTTIRAIAQSLQSASYTGGVNVRIYNLDATHTVDSVYSSSNITLARATFPGAVTVSSGILMTVNAPTGTTFTTSGANASNVLIGGSATGVISRTANQIQVSSTVDTTGIVTVTSLVVNGVRVDTLRTPASYTIQRATFGGTITTTGPDMLDTLTITAPAGVTFQTAAPLSQVTSGGLNAFVLSRTSTQMVVVPSSSGTLLITNVNVGGTVFPSLGTPNNRTISSTTGEAFEPANDAPGGRTISLTGTSAASPLVIFGAVDGHNGVGNDADDFYTFTLGATANVFLTVAFPGNGSGGAANPDIDLLVCNAACSSFPFGFGGATAGQPEVHNIANMPAGTYNIYVNGWETGNATRGYSLTAYQQ